MKNINVKSLVPVVTAIVIFIILTFGYLTPLMKGKVIIQSDMVQNRGMAKEVVDHRDKYHEEALWTNSMFGGMPSYQISITYPNNLVTPLRNAFMLWFPTPANMVFTYLLGFFILLLVLKVDRWLAIVGAIGFAFSAFFFLIIDAGHNTQALAIGYMAPVFAGVILVCRGKYLLGGALTALFFAMELVCNHPQIAYYLGIFCAVYVLFEWYERFKQKQFKDIAKGFAVFIVAIVLAIGCNITNLWNTYDYAKYTIRGPSELASAKDGQQGTTGVDKDYATHWSLGKAETMTLLIPGFKGLGDGILLKENKNALKAVEDPQIREVVANFPQYWGDQPGTSSPYSGAIIVFLFVLGLFIVPGRMKWALLVATILSIALAWGKNMMWLTDLFLDYFPGYSKFRAVSMTLVIAELAIPILAVLAIDRLIKTPQLFQQKIKLAFSNKEITVQNAFFISFGLTGGFALLCYLMPTVFNDFAWYRDDEILGSYAKSSGADVAERLREGLEAARISIFKGAAIRTFFFVTIAAGLMWMYLKAKLNKGILIAVLGVLILFDLALVDKNFLNEDNFTSKQEAKIPFPETAADRSILEDKDPNYRVFDVSNPQETFNSARTSYYHKSIGGYHAAKLRRYQELIEHQLYTNMQNIIGTLRSNPSDSALRATFAQQGVLNMLNMRYLIYNPEAPAIRNRYALGNAWFINDIKMAKNADEELEMIGAIDPARTVVIDERYKEQLNGFSPKVDASGSIKLVDYKTNDLKYESNAVTEQFAVFSEIYYKDWNAYIDGQLTPHMQVNWVLRGMRIPAGQHTIEFKFEPKKYFTGEKIALASCIILFLFIGVSLYLAWKRKEENV
ncbi:MAG: hypothetical protein K0Q95_2974 [Bacteroidota bacterium]|jgi:hypothetical protein|nr:hypothetical protein [Bacteroidota bacterium]